MYSRGRMQGRVRSRKNFHIVLKEYEAEKDLLSLPTHEVRNRGSLSSVFRKWEEEKNLVS